MRIWYQSFGDEASAGAYWKHLRAYLDRIIGAGTSIEIKGISPPDSYAHPLVEMRCARQVVCNAVQAEREGYDAFVLGHFQDAGLYEARSAVDIPVVALGESTMLHACQLGQRIGLVATHPRYLPWFEHQVGRYGLEKRVAGTIALRYQPGRIVAAFTEPDVATEVAKLFEEQAGALVDRGADVLIPAGGIPMLLFSSIHGHVVAGAPVLNGIAIAVKTAELQVGLRHLTGQTASRAGDFAKAPNEIIEEFLNNG